VKEPEMVGDRMRSTCAADMNKMGLDVVSFTLKEVRDKNEYITNMGRPDIARIKRDAEVAAAEADRDIAISGLSPSAPRLSRRRKPTRSASPPKQLHWRSRPKPSATWTSESSYLEMTKKAQATADKAYEIETNVMQQRVVEEAYASSKSNAKPK